MTPVMNWSREMFRPLRGRKPWLARAFTPGHGLRTDERGKLSVVGKQVC